MERYGTSHFTTFAAACRYYREYGFKAVDVKQKIAAGEIHIGAPERKPNTHVCADSDGRYFVAVYA